MHPKISQILNDYGNAKMVAATIKKLQKTPNSKKKIQRYLNELTRASVEDVHEVSQKYSPF